VKFYFDSESLYDILRLMNEGTAPSKPIDFERFRSPNLVLKPDLTIDGNVFDCCGKKPWLSCCSSTLELITGIPALEVEKQLTFPNRGWFTGRIIKYLKSLGYTAFELTKNNVTLPAKPINWRYNFGIKDDHLLLIGSRLDQAGDTSFLLFKGILYHHNHIQPGYNHLYFLNKPITDITLVWHPSWAEKKEESFN
jgi:hypothetical protein